MHPLQSRAVRHPSARREAPGFWHSEGSRSLLIGVIILETVALVVLDAPQRRGIHLVQDHAQDPIQQRRGVRKTFADQALTCFPHSTTKMKPLQCRAIIL